MSSSQLSFASMPPTAAMGLASTSDVPNTAAASIDVELVIIPQPRVDLGGTANVIPVVDVFSRLMTQ